MTFIYLLTTNFNQKTVLEYGRIDLFVKILVFVKIWVNGEDRKENLNP